MVGTSECENEERAPVQWFGHIERMNERMSESTAIKIYEYSFDDGGRSR